MVTNRFSKYSALPKLLYVLVTYGLVQTSSLIFSETFGTQNTIESTQLANLLMTLFIFKFFNPIRTIWKYLGRPFLVFVILSPLVLYFLNKGMSHLNLEQTSTIQHSLYYSSLTISGSLATLISFVFTSLIKKIVHLLLIKPLYFAKNKVLSILKRFFPPSPLTANLEAIDNIGKGESSYHRGLEFEKFICKIFRMLGYEAYTTSELRKLKMLPNGIQSRRGSGEQGVDIIVYTPKGIVAVQVKHYSRKIPNSAVQEISTALPVYGAYMGMVISNQEFSESAVELAKHNHIQLIGRRDLPRLIQKANHYSKQKINQVPTIGIAS